MLAMGVDRLKATEAKLCGTLGEGVGRRLLVKQSKARRAVGVGR